jgi:hypothetical protein
MMLLATAPTAPQPDTLLLGAPHARLFLQIFMPRMTARLRLRI